MDFVILAVVLALAALSIKGRRKKTVPARVRVRGSLRRR